jgi:histidinol-phosphate aminotransferase
MEKLPHVHVVPSHTNFVIFRTLLAPAVLMAKLEEDGVLIRDMSGYPELQGYVRVNAGTEAENKVFLAALKRALA